jgi:SAM-dependent methyltransferase
MRFREKARSLLRSVGIWARRPVNDSVESKSYQQRLAAEDDIYRNCLDVHALPEIFHYWSNRYVRPKLESFGFTSPNALFHKFLSEQCSRDRAQMNTFVSVGSGNCDLEVETARLLVQDGFDNFSIECLDLNEAMLKRGGDLARGKGVDRYLTFSQGDFNRWQPGSQYDAVMANQALHHVLKLEDLFAAIQRSLKAGGLFIISDMIGRNGHLRWPEALAIVQEFWKELPETYRYNHQLKRQEEQFKDWDCSVEGFEGIRSQDILPLLVKSFHFQLFIAFGNVIDPFVDRSFGHNFKLAGEWDRAFIDRVHERDEEEMREGRIKPTHMLAVMSKTESGALRFHPPFTPEFCIRPAS